MLKILQVSSSDIVGGASKISYKLHQKFNEQGYESYLAVGKRYGNNSPVIDISNNEFRNTWARFWLTHKENSLLKQRIISAAMAKRIAYLGEPLRHIQNFIGREDFNFPATEKIIDRLPFSPEVINLHNLHGEYFDLRVLPQWTHNYPTTITFHDTWLMAGHCAYFIDCSNWKTGCGNCPDLKRYPSINFDSTAYNWRLKQEIFKNSVFYVSAVSHWMHDQIKQSMLMPGIRKAKVIHNGVDEAIFTPGDKNKARAELSLPPDAKIILFIGQHGKDNPYKDYWTIEKAVRKISLDFEEEELLLICLGVESQDYDYGSLRIKFISYIHSEDEVAKYFQASDVYLHAANVDTFPNVILEAQGCGTPVIATSVGGIPEQIVNGETGILVARGDYNEMASMAIKLISNPSKLKRLSINSSESIKRNFTLQRMAKDYISWYQEIIEEHKAISEIWQKK